MEFDLSSLFTLAAAGGLAGAVGWSLRAVPQVIFAGLRRAFTSKLEVRQSDLVMLLDRIIHSRGAGRLQQIDFLTPHGARAPGRGWHYFRHGASWIAADRGVDEGGGQSDLAVMVKSPTVNLWCFGKPGPLDALLEEAERLQREDERQRDGSVYFARDYNDWSRHPSHQSGGMAPVILPRDQAREITSAGEAFFGAERWYRQAGANWSEGWLFIGPPGTGKTRTAWGIAQHCGAKLYTLDLSRPHTTNGDIERLMRRIEPRSVLLLDDLDRLKVDDQREGASQVTRAGLLAALELPGAIGRLVIVTANDVAKLDPDGDGALVRPGRIDRQWRFGPATAGQTERMLARFNGHAEPESRDWIIRNTGRTTAELYRDLIAEHRPSSR